MEKVLALMIIVVLVVVGLFSPGGPVALLGTTSVPTGTWTFGTMAVGGLSGLTYDATSDLYYAVSDDRGETGTLGRLYTLRISVDLNGIQCVQVVGVTFLDSDASTPGIQPYAPKSIDAEEVVLTPRRTLIVSSERDQENRPWLREFAVDGSLLREIPLPEGFMPAPGRGTRTNLAVEALALTPSGDTLYVANEEALEQDGPVATLDHGTTVRIAQYDLTAQTPSVRAEFVYVTEPIFAAPHDGTPDNGVSAMLYAKDVWPDYDLFVMERAFSSGVGNDVKVYGVRLQGADDVKDVAALPFPYEGKAVSKHLLARFSSLPAASPFPLKPDNLEALAAGPALPTGGRALLLASDNNFSSDQTNQFVALRLTPRSGTGAGSPMCALCGRPE